MNEYEISKRIDQIQKICEQLVHVFDLAKQQGRMPNLSEAREMDDLSSALLREIRELPENACNRLENAELRERSKAVLTSAGGMLERIAQPVKVPDVGNNPVPNAAASRLHAYSIC
ncbi:hypothetical protein P4C99_15620 [Pontiellaceae bacterium B1224]|nr:hypothetical protein [Pontiellaceae bacterium B1224]